MLSGLKVLNISVELPDTAIPNVKHGGWWVIGIVFALSGSIIGGFGDNVIRFAHRRAKLEVDKHGKATGCCGMGSLKTWSIWFTGILMITVLNNGCTLASYAFADANLVIPFGALHIVWAVLFAAMLNGERLTWQFLLCALVICCGVLIVAVSGTKTLPQYDVNQLREFFVSTPCIIYAAVMAAISALLVAALMTRFCCARFHGTSRGKQLYATAVMVVCGIAGANTNLLAKIVVECTKTALRSAETQTELLAEPVMYVGFVGLLFTAPLQLGFLNYSLTISKATVVVPLTLGLVVCVGTLACILFFEEYRSFSNETLALLLVGLGASAFGIVMLTFLNGRESGSGTNNAAGASAAGAARGGDKAEPLAANEYTPVRTDEGAPILAQ